MLNWMVLWFFPHRTNTASQAPFDPSIFCRKSFRWPVNVVHRNVVHRNDPWIFAQFLGQISRVPNLRGGMVFEIFYIYIFQYLWGLWAAIHSGSSATVAICVFSAEFRGRCRMNHQLRGCQGFPRGEVSFGNLETCPNFKRFHSYSLRKVANLLIYSLLHKNGWKIPLWLG